MKTAGLQSNSDPCYAYVTGIEVRVCWWMLDWICCDVSLVVGLHMPPPHVYTALLPPPPGQARQLFRELPSLVDISIPDDKHFTVCGDVHGQFYDLLNIWELNGMPGPDNPYLFNGEPFMTLLVGCYGLLL